MTVYQGAKEIMSSLKVKPYFMQFYHVFNETQQAAILNGHYFYTSIENENEFLVKFFEENQISNSYYLNENKRILPVGYNNYLHDSIFATVPDDKS